MAHLGLEGVLPPVEAATEVDVAADGIQDISLAPEPQPAALPEDGGEDFFNEDSELPFLLIDNVEGRSASHLLVCCTGGTHSQKSIMARAHSPTFQGELVME